MIMKQAMLFFATLFMNHVCFAQKSDGKIENIAHSINGNILTITYNLLKTGDGNLFEIKAQIIDSAFKKFDINLENANGDIGKEISSGNSKRIVVNLSKINGVKGIYKIQINSYAFKLPAGPESAFKSILIPGLGNMYVYSAPENFTRMFIPLGIVGACALVAISEKLEYDENKRLAEDLYLNPIPWLPSTNPFLLEAEKNKKTMETAILVGAAVWATDVLLVAIKGSQNQRKRNKTQSKSSAKIDWQINPSLINQKTGLSFALKYNLR
jgi:hypothetical protein